MPYERNTHFKIADIVTIPLVYLKGDTLPNIIKTKCITKCEVSGYLKISDDLKKEINKATAEVRKSIFNKGQSTLKQKGDNSNQINSFQRDPR